MSAEKAVEREKLRLWDSAVPIAGQLLKLQIPSSKLQRNIKHQAPKQRRTRLMFGCLEILWSLVLGIWSFSRLRRRFISANARELRNRAQLDSPRSKNRRALPRFAGSVQDQFQSRLVSS